MKNTLAILVQNETLRTPFVPAAFVLALLGVLGLPVLCVSDDVTSTALRDVTLC